MAGLDLGQFKHSIVAPTLALLVPFNSKLGSAWAINQVAGTGLVESGLEYVQQLGGGPALGLCQMEPATHDSLWANYIKFNPKLVAILEAIAGTSEPAAQLMITNLAYSVGMCRIKYWDSALPSPSATDAVGCASYHRTVYNTFLGAANVAVNTPLFQEAINA